jgi:hypothetical protein
MGPEAETQSLLLEQDVEARADPDAEDVVARGENRRNRHPRLVLDRHPIGVERASGVEAPDLIEDLHALLVCEGERDVEPRYALAHEEANADREWLVSARRVLDLTLLVDDSSGQELGGALRRSLELVSRTTPDRRANVLVDHVSARAVCPHLTVVEPDRAPAHLVDGTQVVADEDDCAPLATEVAHLPDALFPESKIADREHLVDEHDLGLDVRGNREREPQVHPPRIALDRSVHVPLEPCEVDDLVVAPTDLPSLHPENRPVQEDVLAARQLHVKPTPDVEQRPDATTRAGDPRRRLRDAAEDLEQRGLAGTVVADHPERLALTSLEAQIAKSPDLLPGRRSRTPHAKLLRDRLLQCDVSSKLSAERVALPQVSNFDRVPDHQM